MAIPKTSYEPDESSDKPESEPEPEPEPETEPEPPTFGDDMSAPALRLACKEYATWCVSHYDELSDVDLADVDIEVSKKLKRTAGKAGGKRGPDGLYELYMRFAMGAYDEWGWEKFTTTVRHELIHILQYQDTGSGDHGARFKRIANKIDCSVHCESFTDAKYQLHCDNCGEKVGERHQKCKIVKMPHRYSTKCCGANIVVNP